VRAAFLRDFEPASSLVPPFQLLVLGGSGGARALNEALLDLAPALLESLPDWTILHQTGLAEFEQLQGRDCHPRHELVPFIARVDKAMETASLVAGRSGASTCAELKAAGRSAILVPLPTSAANHQLRNAQAMAAEGRATVIEQGAGFEQHLADILRTRMGAIGTGQFLSMAPEPNRAVALCLDDLESYLG
jgi:UDP-N-acetylglucosamine--N-acetylmuramyl-(pentapeptide) pyrophosphoryl-undecaprenol N-acetylglucosamine transferase